MLLQHARSLPDGQSNARPVFDGVGKDLLSLAEIAAGIEHAIDHATVVRPFLDLVVNVVIRHQRTVGLSVGPITRHRLRDLDRELLRLEAASLAKLISAEP